MKLFINKLNIARALAHCKFSFSSIMNWRKCVDLLVHNRLAFHSRLQLISGLIIGSVLLAGCASNEQLFARYDALCHQGVCVAARPTEVFYTPEQVNLTWEPAVYFGYDLDFMQESEIVRLDSNLKFLTQYQDLKISLQGFTDSNASKKYNMELSLRRVESVRDYLMQNGVTSDRILASRGGESMPINPNDSIKNQIINRRVEMMLLDASGRPLTVRLEPDSSASDSFVAPEPNKKVKLK